MSKATTAGRMKHETGQGKGVPGGSPTGAGDMPPPIVKGGGYSSYAGVGGGSAMQMDPVVRSAPYKTEGAAKGTPNGNMKIGGNSNPPGERGPEKISGSGKMAARSYTK